MIAFTRDAFSWRPGCARGGCRVIVAKQFIEADLTGLPMCARPSSAWLPYVAQLKVGPASRPRPDIKVAAAARPSTRAGLMGDDGIGHLVMTYATNLAIRSSPGRLASAGSACAQLQSRGCSRHPMQRCRVAHGMVGI